jgi:hypothetical protein
MLAFPDRIISTMHSTKAFHTLTAVQAYCPLKNDTVTIEDYERASRSRIEERDHTVKALEYLGKL